MPTPIIDRMDTLECDERNGVIRSLTRLARVVGMTGQTDYTVLWTALAQAGIPAYGTVLAGGSSQFGNLILVGRSPRVAEQDKGVVDVTLKYEHLLDGPNQQLLAPPVGGILYVKGRSSVVQKPTNFFYYKGDTTQKRKVLEVSHTFSLDDPDPNYRGQNFTQLGEINLPFPQSNIHLEGYLYTSNPESVKEQIHRRVNAAVWMGKPARTWLCSDCSYGLLNAYPLDPNTGLVMSSRLYKFTFEFQYDVDTWDPTITYIDRRTGLPPANILPATIPDLDVAQLFDRTQDPLNPENVISAGYWQVPALPEVDYDAFFQAFFES